MGTFDNMSSVIADFFNTPAVPIIPHRRYGPKIIPGCTNGAYGGALKPVVRTGGQSPPGNFAPGHESVANECALALSTKILVLNTSFVS